MIGICEEVKQFNCDCSDCILLKSVAEKIQAIKEYPEYRPILEWTLRNIESGDCFETLVYVIFGKEKHSSNWGRALTLLVFTYDVCTSIQDDDDVKLKVLSIVDKHLSKQNIDWSVLMETEFTPPMWAILKTLSKGCGSFFT